MSLVGLAFWIGFFHTLIGPDHYIPFVALSQANKWSIQKSVIITALCGLGHVFSSVVIGLIGLLAGVVVSQLVEIEETRGLIATWSLIGFGLAYTVWGIWNGFRNRSHTHIHMHENGVIHEHEHSHDLGHAHVHENNKNPWILFIVFVFGPCEPLIPLLMYPAATHSWPLLLMVVLGFAFATILTMIVLVVVLLSGVRLLPFSLFTRFSHAVAGFAIAICGVSLILFDI